MSLGKILGGEGRIEMYCFLPQRLFKTPLGGTKDRNFPMLHIIALEMA